MNYHARCESCQDSTSISSTSRGERDRWVEKHKAVTGHRWFKVWKVK